MTMPQATTKLFTVALAALLFEGPHSAPPTPGVRLGHSMVYDASQRRVVLIDGVWPAPNQPAALDLWSLGDSQWERTSTTGPGARDVGAAVFDTRRRRLVSFGGRAGSTAKGDGWEWDGKSWQPMADTTPGARFHHAMAYDAGRDRTVMYGGATRERWDTNTWEWNGAQWTKFEVPGPGARAASRMVYDTLRQQVVLFGGIGAPGNGGLQLYFNDTWTWNGRTWRKASDGGPPARRDPSMAFDARAGVVLLYGGASKERYSDMWQWDGARWSEIQLTTPNPGHRYLSAMVYDAARQRTVLYGGYGCERGLEGCKVLDDVWAWDGVRWTRIE